MTTHDLKRPFLLAVFALLALLVIASPQSASALTPQTVTWNASNNLALLSASPLTPNALATSTGSGAISYAVQDAGTTGCTVNSTSAVVTAQSQGLCVIRATAAANATYSSAYFDKTFTFTVNQTVTWTPTTTLLITGSPIMPSSQATSSGPGAISYWVDPFTTNSACSVNATTGEITTVNVGTCSIVASSAAGNGYNSASTTVNFTLTKAQTVTWSPSNTELQIGWSPYPGTAAALTDGTGSISYAVQAAGTTGCSINSSTRTISFSTIGSCVIRATAATNGNWITGYVDVTFRMVDTQYVLWMGANVTQSSGTYTPSQATASGGGIIDYSIVSAGTTGCTIDATTGVITFSAIGQCQAKAIARASGYYIAGAWNQANFNFYANQTVTWTPTNTTNSFSAGTVTPNAAATSSGPGAITYSLGIANASCTVNSATGAVSSSVRGRCYVRATAAASGFYNSAISTMVTFTFTGPQTVTWAASNTANLATHPATPNATPTSNGGAITYSVASAGTAACSVDPVTGVITPSAVGTCTIRATAAAVLTYESGFADLVFTFVEGQNISWPATNTTNADSVATVTPNALATSNLASAITYSVQTAGTTGCSVNSATAVITASAAGVCVIRATAAASGNVASDYRDLAFTFTAPNVSVTSSGSGISLKSWTPRSILLGSQPLISLLGVGFSSDAKVTVEGVAVTPTVSTASELTFVLPKLAVGAHSFVVTFGSQATITFSNALSVVSNEPVLYDPVSPGSKSGSNVLRSEKILGKLANMAGAPVKLACTIYLPSGSTAKERKALQNSTKSMCTQSALKVGAKLSQTKLAIVAKNSSLARKVLLAIELLG